MEKLINLNPNWLFRPMRNGVELLSPEQTISLQIPGMNADKYKKLLRVFEGKSKKSKAFEFFSLDQFKKLMKIGVISISNERSRTEKRGDPAKDILFGIRQQIVSTTGPIVTLYWLGANKSKFSPTDINFFTAKYSTTDLNGKEKTDWSYGADANIEIAELKAIMEGAERLSLQKPDYKDLVKTSARKLGKKALNPTALIAYSKSQYRNGINFLPFSRDEIYYWKEVWSLNNGKNFFLPVECIYCVNNKNLVPRPFTISNSSGVAAGFKTEEAILRGVFECIERDAFMITWLNRLEMPLLPNYFLPMEIKDDLALVEKLGYKVYFVNITLDLAPVVLCVAVSEKIVPALVLGCSANVNFSLAAQKAFVEIEQQIYWHLRKKANIPSINDPKKVVSVKDHLRLYASNKYLKYASFLWQNGKEIPIKDNFEKSSLSQILNLLATQGKEVIVADLTPDSLKKAGVQVIRAMPLGLVPITFGFGTEPLGMQRIREIPNKLRIFRNLWQYNKPFTHPFS